MKVDVSGSRDGQPWPKRGEALNVADDEGASLCASGLAEPVTDADADVEKAVPDDAEQRALTTDAASSLTPGADDGQEPPRKQAAAPAKKAAAKRTPAKPQTEGK
jgi:hypothetical protein